MKERTERLTKLSQAKARQVLDDQVEAIFKELSPDDFSTRDDLQAELVDSNELVDSMLDIYWRSNRADQTNYIPILIEAPFEAPVLNKAGYPSHLYHQGVFDLVFLDRVFGDLVLAEVKTTGSEPMSIERRFEFDPQIGGYLYALKWLLSEGRIINPETRRPLDRATTVGRVVYNVSRKKAPSKPSINKNGAVSTAAIDTLPELYAQAMHEQVYEQPQLDKENPTERQIEAHMKKVSTYEQTKAKQVEILTRLELRGTGPFFGRFEHYRSDDSLDLWAHEQLVTTRQMRSARRDSSLCVRNELACNMPGAPSCPYRAVCIEDHPDVRGALYRIAEVPHEEVAEAKKEQTCLDLQ